MVNFYEPTRAHSGRVFTKAVAEQLIRDEKSRVPKSYMTDRRMAALCTRIANHYRRLAHRLIILHEIETRPRDAHGNVTGPGTILNFEECVETYASVRTWKELHDYLMEHMGAIEGFTTKAAVRAEMLRESENRPLQPAMPERGQTPLAPSQNGRGGL